MFIFLIGPALNYQLQKTKKNKKKQKTKKAFVID